MAEHGKNRRYDATSAKDFLLKETKDYIKNIQ